MTIEDQLRTADPAADVPDDLAGGERGRAALARAMAAGPTTRDVGGRGRTRLLAVAAVGVVAGGAAWLYAGTVAAPPALAGWSATPHPPATAQEKEQAQRCVDHVASLGYDGGPRHDFSPALVEIRGDYAYTVLTSPDGHESSCLIPLRPTDTPIQGLSLTAPTDPTPSPGTIVTRGVTEMDTEDGALFAATGQVGADVDAVHFSVAGRQVEATVSDGRFAAWWPGGRAVLPSFGAPDPDVTITLRDGSTRTDSVSTFRPDAF